MSLRCSTVAGLATAALLLGACGSDGSEGADSTDTTAADATSTSAAETPTTPTEPAPEPLQVLVSNDDGYDAEGIDVLIEALAADDTIELTVYAPLEQRSGSGGNSTDGELAVTDVESASGVPIKAVDGFPADAVRVALDDEGVEADLVVTGINEGQNVGPAVDISGTVGAARAAVARGIPALATSQGAGDPTDYESAVPLIEQWIAENREDLAAGEAPVEVTNLNVPTCGDDEVQGLVETEPDSDADFTLALAEQDCSTEASIDPADGDVTIFNQGYATISIVPDEPAA